ncbi:MAG: hypothetical protein WBG80_15430 [Bacteroidota bacterium]
MLSPIHTALTILICLLFACPPDPAPGDGPKTRIVPHQEGSTPSTIPFTVIRNRVIVPVTVNSPRVLKLVLDTGMGFDGILLYRGNLKDSLGLGKTFEARVPGAGGGKPSTAVVADSMNFQTGELVHRNQRIIVLQQTPISSRSTDGVIGYTMLGHYTLEIDYDEMLITLHEPDSFQADSSWEAIPLTFNKKHLPFLKTSIVIKDEDPIPMDMYVDFAAGEAVELLERPDMKFTLPEETEESYLGTGLSGDIYGKMGRISKLTLGSYELEDVVTAFAPAKIRSKQKGADGILGSDALRRFNIVFDYAHNSLWIKPNSHFREPFQEEN